VQVREDESRARELASVLGGTFEPWGDQDPVVQEARLRERYATARLVISDRMHVLLLAAVDGAALAELVPSPTDKISHAFATVGIHEITLDAEGVESATMQNFLAAQLDRVTAHGVLLEGARGRLVEVERQMRETIRAVRR